MKKAKTAKRGYRKYDESFKEEALNQLSQGRSVRSLSESLGVGEALLYRWRSKGKRTGTGNSEEFRQMKKDLRRLKEDNEILKKALTIFSQSG